MSEKTMEKKNENPQIEEVKEDDTVFEVARKDLALGFDLIRAAAEAIGKNPEVERMWKGISPATGTLWLVEEMVEAMNVLVDVAEGNENEDYSRAGAQLEFSDALNDATGLIELLFGGFGADRINEFTEHYVNEQIRRNRKAAFWYGAIYRRVGSQAYGAHKAADDKQKSPKVRQAIGRQVLHAKAQRKGWDTTVIPKPKIFASIVLDIEDAKGKQKGFNSNITVALGNHERYDLNEIVETIAAAEVRKDLVYNKVRDAKHFKMVAHALNGKKLDKLVAYKGIVKKAIKGHNLADVQIIQLTCKVANLKTDGRPDKIPAAKWDVKIIEKVKSNE